MASITNEIEHSEAALLEMLIPANSAMVSNPYAAPAGTKLLEEILSKISQGHTVNIIADGRLTAAVAAIIAGSITHPGHNS